MNQFQRRKAVYKAQPRLLVLCEDAKSSLTYLQEAARHFRAYAEVEVAHCGKTDPKGIVSEAIQRLKDFDRVICAIDRDDHHGFDEASKIAKAHAPRIELVVSYPCYEFWLYLHFRSTRKPYRAAGKLSAADALLKDLCQEKGMEDYEKGAARGLFAKLLDRLPTARKNAADVMRAAIQVDELNPSTQLHEVMTIFERLGTPSLKD